jgi:hypothetical protein
MRYQSSLFVRGNVVSGSLGNHRGNYAATMRVVSTRAETDVDEPVKVDQRLYGVPARELRGDLAGESVRPIQMADELVLPHPAM